MRAGGCPVAIAQWQSTGGSSQRCPEFDSRWLPAFFTFLYFRLIKSKLCFQHEARCSEQYECYYNLRCIMSSTPVAPPSSRDLTSSTGTECTCKRETFAAPCFPRFGHCLRYLQIWRKNAGRTTQTENSHMGEISWEILSITYTNKITTTKTTTKTTTTTTTTTTKQTVCCRLSKRLP